MNLSKNSLLVELIATYNDLLSNDTKRIRPLVDFNNPSSFLQRKRDRDSEEERSEELDYLEGMIEMLVSDHMIDDYDMNSSISVRSPSKRPKKYDKRPKYFTSPTTGERGIMTPKHTLWWQMYVLDPKPNNKKWANLFRRRFRMPYSEYLVLITECQSTELLKKWCSYKTFIPKRKTHRWSCWSYVLSVILDGHGLLMIFMNVHSSITKQFDNSFISFWNLVALSYITNMLKNPVMKNNSIIIMSCIRRQDYQDALGVLTQLML